MEGLSQKERASVRRAFDTFDIDQSGSDIDLGEFSKSLGYRL